jgi:hypothetical protein
VESWNSILKASSVSSVSQCSENVACISHTSKSEIIQVQVIRGLRLDAFFVFLNDMLMDSLWFCRFGQLVLNRHHESEGKNNYMLHTVCSRRIFFPQDVRLDILFCLR